MTTEESAKKLAEQFAKKGQELDSALAVAIEGASLYVEGEAKKLSPVDTGMLRASINHRVRRIKGKVTGEVGTATSYAPFIEFGTGIFAVDGNGRKTPWFVPLPEGGGFMTRGNRPQPFLTPALNQNKTQVQKIIADGLKDKL